MKTLRRVGAVLVGFVAIAVVSTAIDVALHAAGVYPPWDEPINDAQSALATGYRILVSIAGCYLAARIAPDNPMRHALALGIVGIVVSAAGAAATWNSGLGPVWYPLTLVAVAMPCAWVGGRLHARLLEQ